MAFVQLSNISLSFGDRSIIDDISFNISHESRTALSGGNGSGKSTLMKIIAGLNQADSGKIVKDRESRVAYLPQSGIILSGKTLLQDVETAFEHVMPVIAEKEAVELELSRMDETSGGTGSKLERLHELQEQINNSGYYSRKEAASVILTGLGFSPGDMDRTTGEFSGGWQMRIALARLLLSNPDIMLLDEPTNYLDLEARNWLEGYLNSYSGGFIVVSHDRYFLDSTVTDVAELFNGKLRIYKGNYSNYEKRREVELQQLIKDYNRQQEEIAKTEDFINRFRYQATKAKQVQSRIKQLEKIERIVLPENMKKINFHFPQPPHSGKQVLRINSLFKAYGENRVINDLELQLEAGEKLVIAGRNGAGKSTLMRIIAGIDSDYTGSIEYGSGVTAGYFSQDVDNALTPESSVLEEIESAAPTHLIPDVRGMLGAFLFRGDDIYKSTNVLSGGEKNRLSLLKLLLHPSNLLILDEPTNHLDLQSKQVLLEALKGYEGTLVFVSHDRYFIERLATKVLEIEDGKHKLFPGDYEYFLWRKEQEALGEPEPAKNGSGADKTRPEAVPSESSAKLSHQEEKRIKNRLRKLEREEEEIMTIVEKLEAEAEELGKQLHNPDVYSSAQKAAEVQLAVSEKEDMQAELLQKWEDLESEKAELTAGN
ncbi:MAG: ABC-F family ATP-binding cassette domain-containing protein [Spirochaetales bacterium]|uniref:ABC-F family ATP-binding cassette domain-containing protein n=1 Tax=Candidatus Thalassospirochaeta sargassi TaxID=3119039 RepID=A0AAJ1IG82_9SPIO|nr:ABC-F family ATP-binding cassette domain-containing protein [Spirochaetales bacterium]